MTNWWTTSRTFFSEVISEMRKVSFPPREEVVATTIVVVVTSFIFALYLWLVDLGIVRAYEAVLKVFS